MPYDLETTRYFSLRRLLFQQGVRKEEVFRHHAEVVSKLLEANPRLDLRRYQVTDPHAVSPPNMG